MPNHYPQSKRKMKKDNLPPKKNKSIKNKTNNLESQFSNSPISEFSPIESPYVKAEELFTIDDLIDVWCRGCTNGATLWQYCQDTNKKLPISFEAGLIELSNEVRNSQQKHEALQTVINNNMILLGIFDEKI